MINEEDLVVLEDQAEEEIEDLETLEEETIDLEVSVVLEMIDQEHLINLEELMRLRQDLSKNQIQTDLEKEKLDSFPLERPRQISKKK